MTQNQHVCAICGWLDVVGDVISGRNVNTNKGYSFSTFPANNKIILVWRRRWQQWTTTIALCIINGDDCACHWPPEAGALQVNSFSCGQPWHQEASLDQYKLRPCRGPIITARLSFLLIGHSRNFISQKFEGSARFRSAEHRVQLSRKN